METVKLRIAIPHEVPLTDTEAVGFMKLVLESLVTSGALVGSVDEFLVNFELHNGKPDYAAVAEILKDSIRDPHHFIEQGTGLSLDDSAYDWEKMKVELPKTFSVATITERLRLGKKEPRIRLRFVVNDYKRYWKAQKDKLKGTQQEKDLGQMFLSDLMQMFNQVLPSIEEGKQLQSLLGLAAISPTLNKSARELSLIYKRALKQEKTMGAPTKMIYTQLVEKYRNFIDALLPLVFEGASFVEKEPEQPKEDDKEKKFSYQRDSEGRICLF